MDTNEFLAEQFETHRSHLRAVAYRMLGSLSEADDAVQEAWIRFDRSDTSVVDNLGGWLTTVVSRVCLDVLRSRSARREESLDARLPDPLVSAGPDPESEALVADSVGLAMLVVLDSLSPAERVAFVLHDVFAIPFAEIAPIVDRSTDATKMLASRARRSVQEARAVPDADPVAQRTVVEAFLAAAQAGDFEALLGVLDPDVVLRAETAAGLRVVSGATAVASGAVTFQRLAPVSRVVLVNGTPGLVAAVDGAPYSVVSFTVVGGRIVEMDIISDRDRLARLGITGGE